MSNWIMAYLIAIGFFALLVTGFAFIAYFVGMLIMHIVDLIYDVLTGK